MRETIDYLVRKTLPVIIGVGAVVLWQNAAERSRLKKDSLIDYPICEHYLNTSVKKDITGIVINKGRGSFGNGISESMYRTYKIKTKDGEFFVVAESGAFQLGDAVQVTLGETGGLVQDALCLMDGNPIMVRAPYRKIVNYSIIK